MAQIEFRANLSAAEFPFTLAKSGRTVINPQADQNYDKRIDKDGNDKGSIGIPQAIYLENVFPTNHGYQSVGYTESGALNGTGLRTAVEQIQLATTAESTVTDTEVTWTDNGTNLETWTTNTNPYNFFQLLNSGVWPSPNADMVGFLSYVAETATPHTGYEMRNLIIGSADINYSSLPTATYIQRALPSSTFSESVFSFDIYFTASPGAVAEGLTDYFTQRQFKVATHCTSARAGVFLEYDSNGSVFRLYQDAGHITGGTYAALSLNTHYTVTITTTKVSAGLHQIEVTIYNGVTLVMNVSGLFSVGSDTGAYLYIETTKDNPTATYTTASTGQSAATLDGTWPIDATYIYTTISTIVDDFDITITRPAVEYTITAGLTSVDIIFHSNDTAFWSTSSATEWEGYAVDLPVGFQSPVNSDEFSTANVLGTCFVCIRTGGVTYVYTVAFDAGDLVFTDITTTLATFSSIYSTNDIVGITGAFNYLILATRSVIFWSSTTTPTDFSASLVTGAGSETPNGLGGDITFLKPHVAGFYIYTNGNVVFSAYTGNSRYPWKFREISGSSGYAYSTQVSGGTNSDFHVGLSNNRTVQFLYPDNAKLESPAITDFLLRGSTWDIWDTSSSEFYSAATWYTTQDVDYAIINTSAPRLYYLQDRYILIPYDYSGDDGASAVSEYQSAIVFDTLLRRYGKIKKICTFILANETDLFLFSEATGDDRLTVCFDTALDRFVGEIGVVSAQEGVLVLGKFQLARGLMTQLEGVEIESAPSFQIVDPEAYSPTFTVGVLPALNGRDFDMLEELTRIETTGGELATFNAHIIAKNVSLVIQGNFDINTVVLKLVPAGNS